MRTGLIIISLFALSELIFAQSTTYTEEEALNSEGAILMYEKLNGLIGGDSVRNHDGYACDGWIEDFYDTGELLHKGYYEDGQLRIYKNYYKSKQLERQFKSFDNVRCMMDTYYKNGILRSGAIYKFSYIFKLEERFEDNTLSHTEELHKSSNYYVIKQDNYNGGDPKFVFELTNPRKLKLTGQSVYVEDDFDYVKDGKWIYYSDTGEIQKEESYSKGVLKN